MKPLAACTAWGHLSSTHCRTACMSRLREQGTLRPGILARQTLGPHPKDRRRPQPARHLCHLPPRCADLRVAPVPPFASAAHGALQKPTCFPASKSAGNPPSPTATCRWVAFHFPGGLADYLADTLEKNHHLCRPPLCRQGQLSGQIQRSRFRRMGDQLVAGARRLSAILLQHRYAHPPKAARMNSALVGDPERHPPMAT